MGSNRCYNFLPAFATPLAMHAYHDDEGNRYLAVHIVKEQDQNPSAMAQRLDKSTSIASSSDMTSEVASAP